MEPHRLIKFDTTRGIAEWYNEKYASMGGGWTCPPEEVNRLLGWAMITDDQTKYLLDIGCGEGYFIAEATKRAFCYGIDLSKYIIEKANRRLSGTYCNLSVQDIEFTDFRDEYFTYLVSLGSIEHVLSIDRALHECHRILKSDIGIFLLVVPNELWQHFDQPQEQTHTDEEWTEIFKQNRFEVLKTNRREDLTDFLLKPI